MSSDAAHGGPAPTARPLKLWEQVPLSADNTDSLWSEGVVQQKQQQSVPQNSQEDPETTERTAGSGKLVKVMDSFWVNLSKLNLIYSSLMNTVSHNVLAFKP